MNASSIRCPPTGVRDNASCERAARRAGHDRPGGRARGDAARSRRAPGAARAHPLLAERARGRGVAGRALPPHTRGRGRARGRAPVAHRPPDGHRARTARQGRCCAAAAARRAGFARAALATGALGTALVADIWRNATVPGANDNLSGVAALVALAEELRERPVEGVRVLLVSCGAEETLQDGVRAFIARHRHELPVERTWVINLDPVGSPHLVMLEAEGPVWMESYTGPWLRDLIASCAELEGIELERG